MDETSVIVQADDWQRRVTGPTARMILRLVALADKINSAIQGKIILNYAGDGSVTAKQEIYYG